VVQSAQFGVLCQALQASHPDDLAGHDALLQQELGFPGQAKAACWLARNWVRKALSLRLASNWAISP